MNCVSAAVNLGITIHSYFLLSVVSYLKKKRSKFICILELLLSWSHDRVVLEITYLNIEGFCFSRVMKTSHINSIFVVKLENLVDSKNRHSVSPLLLFAKMQAL